MPTPLLLAHLLAIAVYIGATFLLGVLIPAIGHDASSSVERRSRYASVFRIYGPVAVAALGVIVMTGAWSLTPLKISLGPEFFSLIGRPLAIKLGLAFGVVMFGVYICMGIGLRVVRASVQAAPVTEQQLSRMVRRLHYALWPTLLMAAWATWVALGIGAVRPLG